MNDDELKKDFILDQYDHHYTSKLYSAELRNPSIGTYQTVKISPLIIVGLLVPL